jgi:hypothetical protein
MAKRILLMSRSANCSHMLYQNVTLDQNSHPH